MKVPLADHKIPPRVLLALALTLGPAIAFPRSAHAAASEIVLFDGSGTEAFSEFNGFTLAGGILKGTGELVGKKPFANYELRMEIRYPGQAGQLVINRIGVDPLQGQTAPQDAAGAWLDLRVLYRHLPGEQARLSVPRTGFEQYSGREKQFSDENLRADGSWPRDPEGMVKGQPQLRIKTTQPVEIRRITLRPLEPESPREFLELEGGALDEFVNQGKKVFSTYCTSCHGDGIGTPVNPLSRSFAEEPLQNGSDRLALFNTLTKGYQTMVAQLQLTPEQRHQVAAYISEGILKTHNPGQYKPLDPGMVEALPYPLYDAREEFARRNKGEDTLRKERGTFRDHGPVVISAFGENYRNAAHLLLNENTALSYDLYGMNLINVRTNGFLDMLPTHYYQQRGESIVQPAGQPVPGLNTWFWQSEDTLQPPANGLRLIPENRDYAFDGYFLHDRSAIFSYRIRGRRILEHPTLVTNRAALTLSHRLRVEPGDAPLRLALASGLDALPGSGPATRQTVAQKDGPITLMVVGQTPGLEYTLEAGFLLLNIPASDQPREFTVVRATAGIDAATVSALAAAPSLLTRIEGGARRWPETFTRAGTVSPDTAAYVMDTLPVPYENTYNAWMRTTAVAFFPDGRAVVTTHAGDVWIVSGIDRELKAVTWSRFAAGLYQAFGVKVAEGLVYVTTRNGLVRLHDRNQDGEADYYEQFFTDPEVSGMWHGFNFDLVRDRQGSFYYAKSGQFTDIELEGGVLKVAPDGKSYRVFATGFRTPNGMGMLPDGRITYGENQGNWVPAGKVSIVKEGSWHGGAVRSSPAERIPDPPLLNFPQDLDNSCGGQLWIDDPRFGPYANKLMHTSCGHARAMMLFIDEFEGAAQGAAQPFPFKFDSGVMRLAVNPQDGQVYLTGTRGWQINAPEDGCLQRIRYTGIEEPLLLDVKARQGAIHLTFSQPVNPASLAASNIRVTAWNYQRGAGYGSRNYRPSSPGEVGTDTWTTSDVSLMADRRTVRIALPDLVPADQVRVDYRVGFTSGTEQAHAVHLTIHRLIAE